MKPDSLKRLATRLRPLALNVVLVVASFAFAGLLAEGLIRVVAPQQLILIRPDLWQPADTVGWLRRANVDVRINTGERTVTVLTDERGFRVGAGGPTQAERRVLLLGDSFMEALQVEHEESAAALLEARLSALVGAQVAVRNAGVGGWDPDQYALRARHLLEQETYDLVLTALYLGNDVIPRARDYLPPRMPVERSRLRFPRGLAWSEITDAILRPFNDFFEVRSHAYMFARSRLQTVRMRLGLAPLTFPPDFLNTEAASGRWQVTAEICAEIDRLAAEHSADALFVLIPAPFQVDSLDLMRYVRGFNLDRSSIDLDQPNRLLGKELEDRGLDVYDPLTQFQGAHDEGRSLYGAVDPHFTPEGNELFASLVAPVAAEVLARRALAEPNPSRE